MIKEKKTITLPFAAKDISTAASLDDVFGAGHPGSSSSSGEAVDFLAQVAQVMGQADQLTQVSGQMEKKLESPYGRRL